MVVLNWMLEIAASLITLFIVKDYFNVFLTKKKLRNKKLEFLIWGLYFIVEMIACRTIRNVEHLGLYLLLIWSILCMVLYEKDIKTMGIVILFYFFITLGTELFIVNSYAAPNAVPGAVIKHGIFAWAFSKGFIFLVLQIVKAAHKKRNQDILSVIYWVYCILIPGGSMLLIYTIWKLAMLTKDNTYMLYSALSVVVILFLNILSFLLYEQLLENKQTAEEKNLICKQQMIMYSVENEETWNELKKFRHDYSNHLICIREYLKKNSTEEAAEYVTNLLNNFTGEYGVKKISNSFIDTFLGYKIRNEKESMIEFHTDIVLPKNLPFDETDLCIILGNIFDNAADAVRKLDHSEKFINITMEYRKHTLIICVENPYNGELRKDRKGKLLTTKTNSKNHGIGMDSIKNTIKKYNGFLDVNHTENMFTIKVLLYEK